MEDNFAYQISNSKHSRAAPSLETVQRESDDDRLKRLYLKTAGNPEPDVNLTELESLLTALINAYVSGFQIDGRIPYQLREVFENDMSRFSKNLSQDISKKYQSALNSGSSPEEAMEQSQSVMKEGMRTLAAKLSRYDKDFEALVALLHYKDEGYNVRKRTLYCANATQVGTRRISQYIS